MTVTYNEGTQINDAAIKCKTSTLYRGILEGIKRTTNEATNKIIALKSLISQIFILFLYTLFLGEEKEEIGRAHV